jgi:hypothetical protein
MTELNRKGPQHSQSTGWFARLVGETWITPQRDLVSPHGWEEYSKTWPRSGILRNFTVSALPALVRLTDEIGSGSSLTGKMTHHVPTPTASDHIERVSTSTEVLNFDTNKSVSLDRWVNMFPTPTAGDAKSSGGPCNAEDRRRQGHAIGLHDQVNTPSMWPTPRAKDHKGAVTATDCTARRVANGQANLSEAVVEYEKRIYPTPTANRRDGLQSHGVNVITGSLNPTWVEWLMGFPLGWTDLGRSAMPWFRKSLKSSDAR